MYLCAKGRTFCLLITAFNCIYLPRIRTSCLLIPASKCICVPRVRNICIFISASNCNCLPSFRASCMLFPALNFSYLPSIQKFCLSILAFNCSCLPRVRTSVDPCFQLYLFTTGPNLLSDDAFLSTVVVHQVSERFVYWSLLWTAVDYQCSGHQLIPSFNCTCWPLVETSCLLMPSCNCSFYQVAERFVYWSLFSTVVVYHSIMTFPLLITVFNCSCLPGFRTSSLLIPAFNCICLPMVRTFCQLITAFNCIYLPRVWTFCM